MAVAWFGRYTTPVVAVLFTALLIKLLVKLYRQRTLLRGLPQPPHHPVFGHLPLFAKLRQQLPPHIHPHTYPYFVREKYDLGNFFYIDTWPAGAPMLVIVDPEVAAQISTQRTLNKHQELKNFMVPLGGEKNLVSMDGDEWKMWRSIFNPGFSAAHLMTLVPGIVEDSLVFCNILAEHAEKGDVFRLEEAATRLTVDIIGRVVLDTHLNSQRSENELVNAFRSQVRLLPSGTDLNLFQRFNPMRPVKLWWNSKRMNDYLNKILDERFTSRRVQDLTTVKKKHVIDLALETYFKEQRSSTSEALQGIDETFRKYAIDQIKTFVFAGHDTTSSTICYVFHLLHQHPECYEKVRREHDEVFGTDLAQAADLMKKNPHLLNKLDYTLAVIKEVLRLYPPASGVRQGERDLFVRDPKTGQSYPTEHFMVWVVPFALQRRSDLFPDANSFRPERFLAKEGEPLAVPKDAWRPFEKGARNCIGQELALLETKVIMVLTLRAFDFSACYEDVKDGVAREVLGERAYQVLTATAKPVDGMPARVVKRVN